MTQIQSGLIEVRLGRLDRGIGLAGLAENGTRRREFGLGSLQGIVRVQPGLLGAIQSILRNRPLTLQALETTGVSIRLFKRGEVIMARYFIVAKDGKEVLRIASA